MRVAIFGLGGFGAREAEEGRSSPFGADRFMPARARVTVSSPSRSCECWEVAAEETADGTGEGEGGVMCGGLRRESRGVRPQRMITSSPGEREDERSSHEAKSCVTATESVVQIIYSVEEGEKLKVAAAKKEWCGLEWRPEATKKK